MTGKTDAEGAFGPIEMKGPGVDAWNAYLDTNDGPDANLLQKNWEKRSQVRDAFVSEQKKQFAQLAEQSQKR